MVIQYLFFLPELSRDLWQQLKIPQILLMTSEMVVIFVGVYPGVSTILTTVDTSGRQRTTSLDEYYHPCDYNNANFIRKKHQEQHTAQFLKISNLSSLKTSNITEFAKACQERLSLYDDYKLL
jgi:hypothetical protein